MALKYELENDMKYIFLGALICLSACASSPGPSIPMKPGHNMDHARRSVQSCAVRAERGGIAAVTGGYITGIFLGGWLLGPAVVGINQDNIRETGETDAVDRCLAEAGFARRDLTDGEVFWLNESVGDDRLKKLNHLVGGGTVDTYGAASLN